MRQSVCQSMERPKMNRESQRSAPVQRSGSQLKIPENPSNRPFLYPCIQEAASSSRTNENMTLLVCTHQTFTWDQGRTVTYREVIQDGMSVTVRLAKSQVQHDCD